MNNEKLVHECLTVLRTKTNNADILKEVDSLIDTCILDLKIHGIKKINTDDPIINRCVKIYVKSYFNTSSKDSERLEKSYILLRDSISLMEEYINE